MIELNKIYCGDCLKGMEQIEDNNIDLIVTDIPYFTTKESWDQQWDSKTRYLNWLQEVLDGAYRILGHNRALYMFAPQEHLLGINERVRDCGFKFKRMLVWHHKNLAKSTNKMWLWTYDPIFYLVKGEKNECFHPSFTDMENIDVLCYPNPRNGGKKNAITPPKNLSIW